MGSAKPGVGDGVVHGCSLIKLISTNPLARTAIQTHPNSEYLLLHTLLGALSQPAFSSPLDTGSSAGISGSSMTARSSKFSTEPTKGNEKYFSMQNDRWFD